MLSGVGCHADLQHPRLLLITSGVSLSLPGMDRAWISWATACMVIKMNWFNPTNREHMHFFCWLSGLSQVSVLWWSVWKGGKIDGWAQCLLCADWNADENNNSDIYTVWKKKTRISIISAVIWPQLYFRLSEVALPSAACKSPVAVNSCLTKITFACV